ncbi:hypothetical protein BJ165DRAFT_1504651 [Panaeolus papilionaceus]|nr:hypothetical protein BJ165DRAFT_1504651 [Panaeolus papilionaceus]
MFSSSPRVTLQNANFLSYPIPNVGDVCPAFSRMTLDCCFSTIILVSYRPSTHAAVQPHFKLIVNSYKKKNTTRIHLTIIHVVKSYYRLGCLTFTCSQDIQFTIVHSAVLCTKIQQQLQYNKQLERTQTSPRSQVFNISCHKPTLNYFSP